MTLMSPLGQQLQDQWKSTSGTCGLDAAVRGVLREMKHAGAIGEERRAALAEIETARVEFGEGRDQLCCSQTFVRRKARHFVQNGAVRHRGERQILHVHRPYVASQFLQREIARC